MISFFFLGMGLPRFFSEVGFPQSPASSPGSNWTNPVALKREDQEQDTQAAGRSERIPTVFSARVAKVDKDWGIRHRLLELHARDSVARQMPKIRSVPVKLYSRLFRRRRFETSQSNSIRGSSGIDIRIVCTT